VSESTLEAPPIPETPAPDQDHAAPAVPWTLRQFIRDHPWWTTAVGLTALSAALVAWAGTRPSYDAYGWLVWGHQTLRLSLDLGGAPSWKPLPFLFTVPYALVGHYALQLWMITVCVLSFAGCVFAGRIAYRLTIDRTGERPAAIVAAIVGGALVLGLQDYMHYILSAQSDPVIVTFVLAAIDLHLQGRHRWALAMGTLASLGRPEAWPFLGLYIIWAWFKVPSMRWLIVAALALIAFMWFGVPTITNGRPLVAEQLALKSPRELTSDKITGAIGRFTVLYYLPVWIAALLAVAIALVRRDKLILALAAGSAGWVVVEIAFALHGWPALSRYMFEPAAVCGVLAGFAVGWLVSAVPKVRFGIPRWIGIAVAGVLVLALVPGAVARMRDEHADLQHERGRTKEIGLLLTTINTLGGTHHIRDCGEPVTNVEYVSALAWFEQMDVGRVGHRPDFELHQKYPIVLFTALPQGGWNVLPWHTRHDQLGACLGLHASYVVTPSYPGGLLVPH
jgi:hypothetical protein